MKWIKDVRFIKEYCMKNNIYCEFYTDDDTSYSSSFRYSKFKEIDKLCKTVVFVDNSSNPVVVSILTKYKILQNKLAKLLGVKSLRLAKKEEVEKYTGYKPGAVSPLSLGDILILDKELLNYDYLWFGGGDTNTLVKVCIKDLIIVERPRILEVPKKLIY